MLGSLEEELHEKRERNRERRLQKLREVKKDQLFP